LEPMCQPRALLIGAATAVCAVITGCTSGTLAPRTVDVVSCVDQPFRAALHVDARDWRKVWATDYESGRDVAVRARPPGHFTFDLTRPSVLLDATGSVVSFSGEITTTGCFDAASGVLYIGPGDVPNPNRPPG